MDVSSGISPAERDQNPTKRAGEVARRHSGAIAYRQLVRVGFSASRIARWVKSGRLFPRYPAVFAWGRPDLPEKGELAAGLLFAGHGAALSGISELWWLGLLNRRPDLIHIDAPGYVSSLGDLEIRHPRSVLRVWHEGLPIRPLPNALLDASSDLSHNALRLVLARAEFKRILSLLSLQSALGRGRNGSNALRAAMDAHLPQLAKCANGFERDFVLLCERFRLPIPEPNKRIGRFRPDMLWEELTLIVELDGGPGHTTPAELIRDANRQKWLEAHGYTVVRFTWAEVQFHPEAVAARLRPYFPS